jgi:hypothetical protein
VVPHVLAMYTAYPNSKKNNIHVMNDLEFTKEGFESKLVGARLVVWFKALAVDILTDPLLHLNFGFINSLPAYK